MTNTKYIGITGFVYVPVANVTFYRIILLNDKMHLVWLQNSYNSHLFSVRLSSRQILSKKTSSWSQNRCDEISFVFSLVLLLHWFYAKTSPTLVCSSREQDGERKCFPEVDSGGNVFWNNGGDPSIFRIWNSALRVWHDKSKPQNRYKACSENNHLHITWTMRAWMIFMGFQFTQSKENLNMFIYNITFVHQLVPIMC